ncbi:hypothetical protein [Paenibacillus flagellatus]|uniref:GNAT family N-acetyltransferase n=1 Tax=Paenibacillus flagellatus TaxID=2211139 RepID=A0A2V5KBT5_9BACL|nr:hypothetical protein [Paenibacillus flagellatus]PYI51360.1 hypothetical protein DLM86_25375 [Paenibacillus flagellatus]
MPTHFSRCTTDEDFARASLFVIERKRDLHPSFTTLDAVAFLYDYLTQGHLVQVVDTADNRIVAVSAYYHGSPERQFEDKDVAFIDLALADRSSRGTRVFVNGLRDLADHIAERHPDVDELRFAARADNAYIRNLYAKFSTESYTREGTVGEEVVFCVKINRLRSMLSRYAKV